MRRSIHLALALTTMTLASCLITSDPHFEPPPRTAPFFEPDSATPSTGQVFVIDGSVEQQEETFSARVQSEDAGSDLLAQLYLDYGSSGTPDQVYVDSVRSPKGLTAGSWDDTGRQVSVKWLESYFVMAPGCHRFTLMVVHDGFDERGCPFEPGDYATMTWLVNKVGECPDGVCPDCPEIKKESLCPPREGTPENTGGSQ